MACDAIARLYDVDETTARFEKLNRTNKYDQGTFTFRARNGKLIDLDKMHESVWATRLSGGTRSGLVRLDVTTVGTVVHKSGRVMLRVSGSDAEFLLGPSQDRNKGDVFKRLSDTAGETTVRVMGQVDGYFGRWPSLLKKTPRKPRRILVTGFKVESDSESE